MNKRGIHHTAGNPLPQAIYSTSYIVYQWRVPSGFVPIYYGDSVHVARLCASLPQTTLRPVEESHDKAGKTIRKGKQP